MASELTWINVVISLAFVLFDIGVSTLFRLGIGVSLLIAGLRCVGQLALVATILHEVFETKNPWLVSFICFMLNFLGTFETVVNKSSKRFRYMFPVVLVAMLGSTIPISIIGTKFAMSVTPFWDPAQFIPIVGMLCGNCVAGIVVAVTYILKEFQENRDKVEIYLTFGATRLEACRPIAIQALRLALMPTINSMNVIGIIAIPGMMTGAILGGSSVHQAAKLQMIIMFMITAATVLATVFVTFAAIIMVVDQDHRVRGDRIYNKKPVIYRVKDWNVGELSASLSKSFNWRTGKSRTGGGESDLEENERLLTSQAESLDPFLPSATKKQRQSYSNIYRAIDEERGKHIILSSHNLRRKEILQNFNSKSDFPMTSSKLTWINVVISLTFVLFDIGVSRMLRLGIGLSLLIAGLRCVGQLALVATVLHEVFETKNPWLVSLVCFMLNFLGAFEIVMNQSSRRFRYMFPVVLVSMLSSTIPISIIGTKFAMSVSPFWDPTQFIPVVGMLCCHCMAGILVVVNYILKEFQENKDKIEIHLAFGATRVEACRPIVIQALQLVLIPLITSMSVIGIIAIPGTMTGAILGGSSVHQAAKLQIIIMFMIAAAAVLASIFITFTTIIIVVDQEHRIRSDRIDNRKHVIYRVKDWNVGELSASLWRLFNWRTLTRKPRTAGGKSDLEENERMLT